jgi:MarR family transcriptional regulator, organic hydroperoxide resistance regulator
MKSPLSLTHFSQKIVEILPVLFGEFARLEKNALVRGKITFPQVIALHAVFRQKRLKMKELAGVLSVKMSSATVLADRLIRQGLAKRYRDEHDRRLVWIELTPSGRRIIQEFLSEKQKSVQEIFGVLTSREREAYLKAFTKVAAHLVRR